MRKIFLLAAVPCLLAACDNTDNIPEPGSEVVGISAGIGGSGATRASDTSWETGDRIGITLCMQNGVRPHVNMEYSTDGGSRFTGNPIYFYKPMTLIAYYPFSGNEGTAPDIVDAVTTAAYQTEANQPKIDFLWDKQEDFYVVDGKPEVHFNFNHTMSRLTLIFNNGDGMDVRKIVSYSIDGLVMTGSFNPETGVCAIKDDASEESLSIDLTDIEVASGKSIPSLILFPQAPGSDKVKLHLYANEVNDPDLLQHYVCTLAFEEGKLKPGMNYVYTVKVSKAGVEIENTDIKMWVDTTSTVSASSSD